MGYPGRHWTTVFNYVRTTWPFWNMTAGRNHIAWATNDRGVCDLYRHQPELQHPIKARGWKEGCARWYYLCRKSG